MDMLILGMQVLKSIPASAECGMDWPTICSSSPGIVSGGSVLDCILVAGIAGASELQTVQIRSMH